MGYPEKEDIDAALWVRMHDGKKHWHAIIPSEVWHKGEFMYLRPQTLCGWDLSSLKYERAEERSLTKPDKDICRNCTKRINALTR